MGPKRIALWFLIISVAISAALGILAILTGNFGELEIRIILTTLTISAASVCALAGGALWEIRNTPALPSICVVLAILAALQLIIGIWLDPADPVFWRLAASVSVLAVASAQASLVSLAKLARRFNWTRVAALSAIFLLAVLIIIVIWFEPRGEGIYRIIGADAIVVAALTIMMPIFHRLSRGDLSVSETRVVESDQHLFPTVLCPRCGTTQDNSPNQITCTSCGCLFVVTILDEAGPGKPL